MRPFTFSYVEFGSQEHITTATIGFNVLKQQQETNNNPQQFKKAHYTKIKLLTKKNLKKVS